MSDAQTLEGFFGADDAPKQDAHFRIAIMEQVARRRFRKALISDFAMFIAAALALWFVAPILVMNLNAMGPSAITIAGTLIAVALVAWGGRWVVSRGHIGPRRA